MKIIGRALKEEVEKKISPDDDDYFPQSQDSNRNIHILYKKLANDNDTTKKKKKKKSETETLFDDDLFELQDPNHNFDMLYKDIVGEILVDDCIAAKKRKN